MMATRIVLNHRRFVIVPESDWVRIATSSSLPAPGRTGKAKARASTATREALPALPPPDQLGNRPAVAFADASIARGIIGRRKRLGLSQVGLANLAGIRVEVLNRAERSVTIPSLRTLTKIESVLTDLERRASRKPGRSPNR